jgi:outer membrane PBP1 activator LpoA protein
VGALVKTTAVVLWLIVGVGCETTPTEQPPITGEGEPKTGEALLAAAEAAQPMEAAELYLAAARAFHDEGDRERAEAALDAVEAGLLSRPMLPDYHLLRARLAVDRGDMAAAAAALAQVTGPLRQSDEALLLESDLCALEGNDACALETLVQAADGTTMNEAVWAALNRSATMSTVTGPLPTSESPTATAWRQLHRLTLENTSVGQTAERIEDWLRRHPRHPAAIQPPVELTLLTVPRGRQHVGLMLPLSGPLSRAGEAVRDGFVSSTLIDSDWRGFRLTVYDTNSEPVASLYERALADGVDFLVGPLQKETVADLNLLNPEVPALVLNYLEPGTVPAENVFQLGLAIEDEAGTIVTRLERDGISNALLFHDYDDWSLRARQAVVDTWPHHLMVEPFTDVRTITEAVGRAMLVSESEARRDEMTRVLGFAPEFLPRARTDVDGVIALVDNVEANALVPALSFHFANDLPVYASSQVTRRTRSDQLAELDGFHVSELPWFLEGHPLFEQMREPLALDTNPFASLVALGADAFRMVERAPLIYELRDFRMLGSTGFLTLRPDGRITRELAWGQITGSHVTGEFGGGP